MCAPSINTLLQMFSLSTKIALFGVCITALIPGHAIAQNVEPSIQSNKMDSVPTETFLSSMGICIHHAQGVPSQSYILPLRYLGVRNIRDDFGKPQGYIHMRKQAGVRANLIASSASLETTLDTLKYLARDDALLSVEGPNEPNNFPIQYQGEKGGGFARVLTSSSDWTPVAKFQRDLYAAVKSDPLLSKFPVFHTSEAGAQSPNVGLQFLTIPEGAGTTFPAGTKYADFANVHNYVSGTKKQYVDNQAWNAADPVLNGGWDGLYVEYGKLWGHGYSGYSNEELQKLPRVTTETGWDSSSDNGGERVQGTVLLNTYLSQFKRGWRYTFVYMLRDGEGGAGNQGVFKADSTPKLAATYIHNFTTILSGAEKVEINKQLTLRLRGASATTHDILLQTKNDEFAFVVWGERVSGSEKVTIELGQKAKILELLDPTVGTEPFDQKKMADTVEIEISDHPIIVRIKQ
ncbi:hypothetical protein SAMN05192568_11181 [Methylobacterium pseudosasicola]|uniref:Glycosyl hydrolase family 30 beta sandwich domain-containing protein n=2 Tax=Methylobacterium pseudosasicola TaxID=582667 RepID=A0A1I4VR87_9HYPH|nr:hypothetical protein SAMN05192568_11181 [Methylobacterium pseudosasicola]